MGQPGRGKSSRLKTNTKTMGAVMQHAPQVRQNLFLSLFTGAVLAISSGAYSPALADDFYKGKTVNFVIGNDVGGDYDTQSRLIARFLPQHIPGNPAFVAQNMVGASGLKATNFMYNTAPKDGLTIGMVAENLLQTRGVGFGHERFQR